MFSLSLYCYFTSAYVTFIESSFYFKSLSSSLVSLSNQVHISIIFNIPIMSSVPKDFSHIPPLYITLFIVHSLTLFLCQLFHQTITYFEI